ncbi:MAG: dodecin family protein [Candidatus Omnitrophica bacterium]|nr:dodecin family protein [Candidatus Omnitrophota bacterium]
MFQMVEVVGISPDGFSEAVKNAVDQVIKSGGKPHFFEVVEQRGSIRDGQLKEYQAIVKVAVEAS